MQLGHQIDSAVIQRGLLMLNPDMAFDVANKLEDWNYMLQMPPECREALERNRLPVLYREKYIVSLDRGIVPEVKVFEEGTRYVEQPCDSDTDGGFYCRTAPQDRSFPELLERVQSGDRSCELNGDGTISRYFIHTQEKVLGKVLFLGWRHTFERLIQSDIPGITRESLQRQFGVDMYKTAHGPLHEMIAE